MTIHFAGDTNMAQFRIEEIQGPRIAPVWYCLLTPPQKENAARANLKANGIYAFYPSREKRWTVKGKTHRREIPEVSGYVFAQFRFTPNWFVLKERWRLISGVLSRDGVPVPIRKEVIKHMHGLTVDAQRLEEAKRELLRVRPGDRAEIIDGPLKGFFVDVLDIEGGEAVLKEILGKRGRAAIGTLRRVLPKQGSC